MSNGYVLYDGPSAINGQRIVCIATNLVKPSSNIKTGPLVQTYIMAADQPPHAALATGADAAVCGGCSLRPQGRDGSRYWDRACYVNVSYRGPAQVYRSWVAGSYPALPSYEVFRRRRVRFGAYGDPAAVPLTVWSNIAQVATGWTGYTHQWRAARLRGVAEWCMASCETDADEADALALGLTPYRIVAAGQAPLQATAVACPAGNGGGVQCYDCMACNGQGGTTIYIEAHGSGAKHVHDLEEVFA